VHIPLYCIPITVPRLEDLLALKRDAGRAKDMGDIRNLREIRKL